MEVLPDYFPAWEQGTEHKQTPNVIRSNYNGNKNQRRVSHRVITEFAASITLVGALAPAFMYFINVKCDSIHWFQAKIKTSSGIDSAVMRIKEGKYTMTTNDNETRTISCTIEVKQ